MLVVNLVFVLFLLLGVRKRWLAKASNDDLKRRQDRRDFTLGLCFFLAINVALPVVAARTRANPALVYWGAIFGIGGVVSLYQRLFPRTEAPPMLNLPTTFRFEISSRVAKAIGVRFERQRQRETCIVQCGEDEAIRLLVAIHRARSDSDDPLFRRSCFDAATVIQEKLSERENARLEHHLLRNVDD